MRLIWREEKRAPSPTFPKIKGYGDALMAAHRRGNPECSLRWCARSRRWDRGPRCPSAVTSGCGRERRGALRVSEPALGGRRRSGSPNTTPRPEEGKAQPRVARTLKRCAGVPSSERAGRPGVGKPNRAAPGNGSLRGCDSLKYFSPRPRRLRPSEGTRKAQLRNAAPFVSALSRRPRPEGAPRSGERSARPGPGTQRAPRI